MTEPEGRFSEAGPDTVLRTGGGGQEELELRAFSLQTLTLGSLTSKPPLFLFSPSHLPSHLPAPSASQPLLGAAASLPD